MFPYSCHSYKDALKQAIEAKKHFKSERRYTYQAMAAHCGIQKTYLSKVLNHDGHLSEDQLFAALEYVGLEADEIEYCVLLMSREKTQSSRRREALARKLQQIRQAKTRTEARMEVANTGVREMDLAEYYLDPLYQIIHMALTLKRFQQEPMRLGEPLRLSPGSLRQYLKNLQKMRIVRFQESRDSITDVAVISDHLHLPQESVLHEAYAARMRHKAIEQAEKLEKGDAFRFSVVFSTDRKTCEAIHASFLDWQKKLHAMVTRGGSEEVHQINFDLLRWV